MAEDEAMFAKIEYDSALRWAHAPTRGHAAPSRGDFLPCGDGARIGHSLRMFVRSFLELPFAADRVEGALLTSPGDWIPGVIEDASRHGESLLAEVGFDTPGRRIQKKVELEIAQPIRLGFSTLLPITWRPAGLTSLFPVMEADIEVAALGHSRTQLSFNGRYKPPLSVVGQAADRVLLHRVAEATTKDFLEKMARKLSTRLEAEPRAGVATS
jgi:hypothetical protein